jgi:hypothetical protein
MKNKKIKDELNELSPFLSDLNSDRKEGFTTPDNYFERFEDRLMSRIREEEALSGNTNKETAGIAEESWFMKTMRLLITPKYAASFASCMLLLVFGLNYILNKKMGTDKGPLLLAQLTIEETNEYIINNIEDFATADIIESIGVDVIDEIHNNLPALGKQIQEVEKKPIVDNNFKTEDKSAMDKAIEATDAHDLLDDLTEDDIEEGFYDDIF